jgi:hypothetical protein
MCRTFSKRPKCRKGLAQSNEKREWKKRVAFTTRGHSKVWKAVPPPSRTVGIQSRRRIAIRRYAGAAFGRKPLNFHASGGLEATFERSPDHYCSALLQYYIYLVCFMMSLLRAWLDPPNRPFFLKINPSGFA